MLGGGRLDLDTGGDDGDGQVDDVGADGAAGEGEDVVEGGCLGFPPGERLAARTEEFADGGYDGGVLVVAIVQDGIGSDAW